MVIHTRKDRILLAEAFIASAYLGLSIVQNDRNRLLRIRNGLRSVLQDQVSSQEDIRTMPSAQDLANAVTWTLAQPRLGLTVRQGRLLYLRGYCGLPWKELAVQFRMSWAQVRAEYDSTLVDVYHEVVSRTRKSGPDLPKMTP